MGTIRPKALSLGFAFTQINFAVIILYMFYLAVIIFYSVLIIERMRAPVRHISYGIRHCAVCTALWHMNGTITMLVPLYEVFQHFPIDMNRLSSR